MSPPCTSAISNSIVKQQFLTFCKIAWSRIPRQPAIVHRDSKQVKAAEKIFPPPRSRGFQDNARNEHMERPRVPDQRTQHSRHRTIRSPSEEWWSQSAQTGLP